MSYTSDVDHLVYAVVEPADRGFSNTVTVYTTREDAVSYIEMFHRGYLKEIEVRKRIRP